MLQRAKRILQLQLAIKLKSHMCSRKSKLCRVRWEMKAGTILFQLNLTRLKLKSS